MSIRHWTRTYWLTWAPVGLLLVWLVLVFNPITHEMATDRFATEREWTATEIGTAVGFCGAFFLGLWLTVRHARRGAWLQAFYFLVFALFGFFAFGEEVQYGQPLLGFGIPDWMAASNAQAEFTLHNMGEVHGKPEIFYVFFCVMAYALCLPRMPLFPQSLWQDLRSPHELLPILHCILVTTILKIIDQLFDLPYTAERAIRWTAEFTELYIAVWALVYVALKLWRPEPELL